SLSPDANARLRAHSWPGNVRELSHLIDRLVILGRAAQVEVDDLPVEIRSGAPPSAGASFTGEVLPIRELQRRYAHWALDQCGGKRGRAAERLGVDGKTLARWLDETGGEDAP
ncbi:MAG: sigma-54-dependent Fis family transcriptional regulator, partial [Deltaproteobacteria bacterium]|nr:sigma-54-dependent Fis family transcriptional regulator [Deltaproteobacteria bacterium]